MWKRELPSSAFRGSFVSVHPLKHLQLQRYANSASTHLNWHKRFGAYNLQPIGSPVVNARASSLESHTSFEINNRGKLYQVGARQKPTI